MKNSIEQIERTIVRICKRRGIFPDQIPYYLDLFREVNKLEKDDRKLRVAFILQKWLSRGLDFNTANRILQLFGLEAYYELKVKKTY